MISFADLIATEQDDLKWETRFFWPEEQIISLTAIDDGMLDLAKYHQKHKDDHYYLLPETHCNIKRRRGELLYKPIHKQTTSAVGFGMKIDLEHPPAHEDSDELRELARKVNERGIEVHVKKEAFIYKFPTHPHVKLELARLEVNNMVYFSACIEGKSLYLVETLSELLLGKQVSCEYVTFLKNILKL